MTLMSTLNLPVPEESPAWSQPGASHRHLQPSVMERGQEIIQTFDQVLQGSFIILYTISLLLYTALLKFTLIPVRASINKKEFN